MENEFLDVLTENNFSWKNVNTSAMFYITKEFFQHRVYDWFYQVQPGDIVVDIGASVGPFSIMSLDRNCKKLYIIEPSKDYLRTAIYNCSNYIFDTENKVVAINKAIGEEYTRSETSVYGPPCEFQFLSFNRLIKEYNISYIDFLKIDCEGGEYTIFTQENIDFLKYNVKHIAVEMHVRTDYCLDKFIEFRNNILPQFTNWSAITCSSNTAPVNNEIDIRYSIFDDNFISKYKGEFMMYIGGKCPKHI